MEETCNVGSKLEAGSAYIRFLSAMTREALGAARYAIQMRQKSRCNAACQHGTTGGDRCYGGPRGQNDCEAVYHRLCINMMDESEKKTFTQ